VKLLGTLVFGSVLAGVGVAYYVRERSQTTGQSYLEVLRQLPSDVRRGYGEAQRRAQLALNDGLRAARLREQQVHNDLIAAAPRNDGAV